MCVVEQEQLYKISLSRGKIFGKPSVLIFCPKKYKPKSKPSSATSPPTYSSSQVKFPAFLPWRSSPPRSTTYKTGVKWHELWKFDLASSCFERAIDLLSKIGIDTISDAGEKKMFLDLSITRSKTAWEVSDRNLAVALLNRAKSLLFGSPKHYKTLANQYSVFEKSREGTAGAETAKEVFLRQLCHVSANVAVRVSHRALGESCSEGSKVRAMVVSELVSDDRVVALFSGEAAAKQRTAMHAVLWNWKQFWISLRCDFTFAHKCSKDELVTFKLYGDGARNQEHMFELLMSLVCENNREGKDLGSHQDLLPKELDKAHKQSAGTFLVKPYSSCYMTFKALQY